jgi:hypothetical protein
MDGSIYITLDRYLLYLETQPDTRKNQSLIDCVSYLLTEKPDTHESLKEGMNGHQMV